MIDDNDPDQPAFPHEPPPSPQHHAAGTITGATPTGQHRGLCWCGWRGQPHPAGDLGQRRARHDADRHVDEARRRHP